MNKKEFKKTEWYKDQIELAKKFKLSVTDIHNLYDLFEMTNWEDYGTLKLNKMHKWFKKFFFRLEEICLEEQECQEKIN